MTLVAGVDCSTQSTKVVVCDARTGAVQRAGGAPHLDSTEVDPHVWERALATAGSGLLDDVRAIAVSGQQHGLVTLDETGAVIRPALLWNDTRSAAAAGDLVRELGGARAWAEAVGSVPVASFTVTKLRWLAEHEPEQADRVHTVLLPHDWMTWRLLERRAPPVTDRGDASGTGYWSPFTGDYRLDLLKLAFGRCPELPRVLGPVEAAGETPDGLLVAAGTGDNMGAALGLGATTGDVIVSIGTSGVAAAVSVHPTTDSQGQVAGFADATGHFLPLVCTLNAARVLTAAAQLLGTDLAGLDRLALAAPAGSEGLVLLPYLDGERTPDLPDASGALLGLVRGNSRPENVARAAVEGLVCGLADGLDALRAQGVQVRRALLVGGGSRSAAVRAVAGSLLGCPVEVPEPAEYVALGAARQAAWLLSGDREPPDWVVPAAPVPVPGAGTPAPAGARAADVRERYGEWRQQVYGQRLQGRE